MKHYEEIICNDDNFKDKTVDYLKAIINDSIYKDIDGCDKKANEFYVDIIDFLNKQSGNKKRFHYNEKYPYCIIDNKEKLHLRTDQFGFSFRGISAYSSKYPYGHYLQILHSLKEYKKISEKKLNEELNFIADCVSATRTIGGCFIWPVVLIGKTYTSQYNKNRGIGKYIEDRVDLTLWEIKEYYKKSKEDREKNPNNLVILRNEKDKDAICQWLDSFGNDFEDYVKFFRFDGNFVRNDQIVDIINSDVAKGKYEFLDDEKVKEYKKQDKRDSLKQIQMIKEREILRRTLENVKLLTEKRSKEIEKPQ